MENEKGLYTTGREDSFKRVYPSITPGKGKIAQPIKGFNSARKGTGCITGTYQNSSGYGKDKGFTKQHPEEQGMWWLMLDERRKSVEILSTEEMIQMAS